MTGDRQLVLELPSRPALGREAFFVSPANAFALALVERWPDWPERRLAIAGPEGSGKTHLAHVWAARAGALLVGAAELPALDLGGVPAEAAVAVEDADRIAAAPAAEEALFHLCNRLSLGGGSLLVTGREPPARWRLGLPDLESRLGAAPVARLEAPDDRLLAAVLVKLFADRQLAVAPDLVGYLVSRLERRMAAADAIVDRLDRAALAKRRPITIRLAAEAMRDMRGA